MATFKSAADLAEEFDYVFCHGESLLYEEVEKHAPSLFKRIQKLVKEGKWVVTGGMYLQPDCLFPAGESFVRQIEVGQKYFREKFGIMPTVVTNYDSFGHSIGLVQIYKKCGYEGMLCCRPATWQMSYPSKFFDWVSPEGSRIVVSHSSSYNSHMGDVMGKLNGFVYGADVGMLGAEGQGKATQIEDVDYLLWGVGNHGGGPSRKDLRDLEKCKIEGVEVQHSTPERLFADNIKVGGEVKTSLITCMPGCYSSMAKLKQAHRQTESLFYATEKMLSVAKMAGYEPDLSDWGTAEKKLLLAQFHDILPGTSIVEGEQDGMELLSMAKKIVKDHRTGAFLYLVMGEDVAKEGEFPVFVFNYMPYAVETPVEVEFSLADQNWSEDTHFTPYVYTEDGELVPSQTVKEGSTLHLDWRKRVVFEGKLKPLGITKFSIYVKPEPVAKTERKEYGIEELIEGSVLRAPVELETYDDTADPWGMSLDELKHMGKNGQAFRMMTAAESARFCGFDGEIAPVHTIEDGAVTTAVEATYTNGHTNAAVEYRTYKKQPYVDLKVTVEYVEKNKMIRLKIPAPKGVVIGDGPFIVEEKNDFGEITFQKWFGVQGEDGKVFSVINDGVYAGTTADGYLYLTLVRGSGYCIHPIGERELYPHDRYLPRIEGGRYEFKLRIYCGSVAEVNAEAELFNQKPYAINVFPTGEGRKRAWLETDGGVTMPVCRIEGDGYTLRFFNPENKDREARLQIGDKAATFIVHPYEVLTVKYDGEIRELRGKFFEKL